MNEAVKFEGRLGEQERKKKELILRLKGLLESLRDQLDPTVPVQKLKGEIIADQAIQFSQYQVELEDVLADIAKINELLGRA